MTECISRDVAKAFFTPPKGVTFLTPLYFRQEDVIATLDNIPAADVRPVVLCRDCTNRFMTPNGWHCHYAEWAIEDDDFCSCGEKREES